MTQATALRADEASRDGFALAADRLSAQRPLKKRLLPVVQRLKAGDARGAEEMLGPHLEKRDDDADALYLMARVQLALGRREAALAILARCLEQAPDFDAARFDRAQILLQLNRLDPALAELEHLLGRDAGNPLYRQLKANIFETIGRNAESLALCETLAAENPARAESWVSYGHALRAVGSAEESVAAYRKAIALKPAYGKAWWSLANMKTARFGDADIAAMEAGLARPEIPSDDRIALHFSLGKAFEDRADHARAFEHYAKGNAATRLQLDYDADRMSARVAANKALFTAEFFRARAGTGAQEAGPIFIVGRPRSGSTLIEQILCSHSAIEGTAELPYIGDFARALKERGHAYPAALAELSPDTLKRMGEAYLESAGIYRRLGRPFFIDKKPANFWHVGMIRLILPNAKIVDARRHPVASGMSIFRQYFSKTNLRLAELGRHYRDYVALMAHFDRVLPGAVHRVVYERMVSDTEAEVRALLDYLGLPFEESCLRFYENKRTVLTPSSEQVRRPITSEAVDQWRSFEPWLGPLIRSLGSALDAYPDVPGDLG